jgi:hypothetical protein
MRASKEVGTDCGDVSVKAANEVVQLALECARDALAAANPFQLFWSVVGADSVNHLGVIARRDVDALENVIASLPRPIRSAAATRGTTRADGVRQRARDL